MITKRRSALFALMFGLMLGLHNEGALAQIRRPTPVPNGVLQVIINGPANAGWKVNAPNQGASFRKSGQMVSIPAGSYTVSFLDVDDFVAPKPVTVSVFPNRSTPLRVEYRPGRPKALTAVYEPGATYTRCFPTKVTLGLNYPTPGSGDFFEKTFAVTQSADGNIDPSPVLAGMRAELKERVAKYGCDVALATPSASCQLSAEEFADARRMYVDQPGLIKHPKWGYDIATGPFDQGMVEGERHTATYLADDKVSPTGLVLEWTTDVLKLNIDSVEPWGDLAKMDVCGGSGYSGLRYGSYSTVTLAGQGVTRGSTNPTKYISVNQKLLRYFVTPLLVQDPYFPSGWDQAAFFNQEKICAPLSGPFVPWKIGEPKDVTDLLTYPGKSPTSTKCDLFSALPTNTILYDIASPIVVKGMSAVMEGLVNPPGTNTKPSLRPLSLETNPFKFFVKVAGSEPTPTPTPPATATPIPPLFITSAPLRAPALGTPLFGPVLGVPTLGPIQGGGSVQPPFAATPFIRPVLNQTPPSLPSLIRPVQTPVMGPIQYPVMGPLP